MITEQHITRMLDLLSSGDAVNKRDAFNIVYSEDTSIADSYGSIRSVYIRCCQLITKRLNPDPLEEPLNNWTVQEKLDAADLEIQAENVRLAKQRQFQQDRNRIERKAFRNYARSENAVSAYARELVTAAETLKRQMPDQPVRTGPLDPEAPIGIVHLSDLHLNELIDQPDNKYDFEVAARRLQKLSMFVKAQCETFQIERLVVCFGGDLLNSDRRLDELLHMATNRARATMLGVHLLQQFLMDLREDCFIDCIGITGNEGRAQKELGWADTAVTDNYDAQIYGFLAMINSVPGLEDAGLRFHELHGNESVFTIHDQTILLLHGHQVNCSDQKKVQSIIGQKAATTGQRITHLLAGHIHASLVGDYVSRNASLAGANAYSGDALQLASKAAQNFHVVDKAYGGSMYGMKVDLQNVEGIGGYHVVRELEAYNAKSHDKAFYSSRKLEPIVVAI